MYIKANDPRDPSQKAAVEASAIPTVFTAISKTDDLSGPLHPSLRVLEILLAHESGPSTAPESAFQTLLSILLAPTVDGEPVDFDNALSIISIIHTLAPLPRFTTLLSTDSKLFPELLEALEWTIKNVKPEETDDEEKKRKDAGLVAHAKNQLVESVGEAAAADNFLNTFPFTSPVMQRVKDMLQVQEKKEELAIAACMILGNVGRSDAVCSAMMAKHSLHIPVMSVISTTLESYARSVAAIRSRVSNKYGDPASIAGTGAMSISTLHAGLGVLKNLALPSINKPKLGSAGVFPLLQKLLELDGVASGQIYYSTISLIRILINLCPENVERLFIGSPMILLEKILERGMKSDAEAPLKVEAMRTVVGIIRTGYKFAREDLVQKMIDTQGEEKIAEVLWGMVAQGQYASVRSEGLFALALMGSENEGQGVVKVGWKKIWGEAEKKEKREEDIPGKVLGEIEEEEEKNIEEKGEVKEEKKGKTGEELLMEGLSWGAKDSDNIMAVAAAMGKEGENVLRAALGGRVEVVRSLENEIWST